MVLKRVITPADWVSQRRAPPPPASYPPSRSSSRPRLIHRASRESLMQALLAEISRGNSLTKLYALMLAQEILAHDPKLARQYRHQLEAVQE
jgi:hypothetical protein